MYYFLSLVADHLFIHHNNSLLMVIGKLLVRCWCIGNKSSNDMNTPGKSIYRDCSLYNLLELSPLLSYFNGTNIAYDG